jgi:hypothetical protein
MIHRDEDELIEVPSVRIALTARPTATVRRGRDVTFVLDGEDLQELATRLEGRLGDVNVIASVPERGRIAAGRLASALRHLTLGERAAGERAGRRSTIPPAGAKR